MRTLYYMVFLPIALLLTGAYYYFYSNADTLIPALLGQ